MDIDLPLPEQQWANLTQVVAERYRDILEAIPNLEGAKFLTTNHMVMRKIGFYGSSGSGKSTLVNRLLGVDVLPADTGEAITGSITEIVGHEQAEYNVMVYFISLDEWEEAYSAAKEAVVDCREMAAKGEESTEHPEVLASFLHKLASLWPENWEVTDGSLLDGYNWEKMSASELIPTEIDFYNSFAYGSFLSTDELKSFLALYASAQHRNWPLVARITLSGPFEYLKRNAFSFLDIPGDSDGNAAFASRFEEGIRQCQSLFFLPKVNRPATGDTIKEILGQPPHCSPFGVIVTHAQTYKKSFPNADVMKKKLCTLRVDSTAAQTIQATPMFLLENGDVPYPDDFDGFCRFLENHENEHLQARINALISTFNLNVASIRQSLETTNTQQRDNLSGEIRSCTERHAGLLSQEIQRIFRDAHLGDFPFSGQHWRTIYTNLGDRTYSRIVAMSLAGPLLTPLEQIFWTAQQHLVDSIRTAHKTFAVHDPLLVEIDAVLDSIAANKVPFRTSSFMGWDFLSSPATAMVNAITAEASNVFPWFSFRDSGTGCRDRMVCKIEHNWKQLKSDFHSLGTKAALAALKEAFEEIAAPILQGLSLNMHSGYKLTSKLDALLRPVTRASSPQMEQASVELEPVRQLPLTQAPVAKLTSLIQENVFLNPLMKRVYNTRDNAGYVYVLSNRAYPNIYKIGETHAGTVAKRAKGLYSTGVLYPFEEEHKFQTSFCRYLEKVLHQIFDQRRVRPNREFFDAPLQLIIEVGQLVAGLMEKQIL